VKNFHYQMNKLTKYQLIYNYVYNNQIEKAIQSINELNAGNRKYLTIFYRLIAIIELPLVTIKKKDVRLLINAIFDKLSIQQINRLIKEMKEVNECQPYIIEMMKKKYKKKEIQEIQEYEEDQEKQRLLA